MAVVRNSYQLITSHFPFFFVIWSFSYMFSKYDQGSLLGSQFCDEFRIESKLPDVSFIACVEENRTVALLPVLVWNGKKCRTQWVTWVHTLEFLYLVSGFTCDQVTLREWGIPHAVEVEVVHSLTEILLCELGFCVGSMFGWL